jgi:hypothetical protein
MPKAAAKTEKSAIPKKMKAIEKLYSAGIRTQEQLMGTTVKEMAEIPDATNDDVRIMLDIQKYSGIGMLYRYLCEDS